MPGQSRKRGYGKKRMHKHRGGGWFDKISKQATELKDSAIQKSKDMGLHDKVGAAHQAAIGHANTAKQLVVNAHSQAMQKGAEIHAQMKPHLDVASGHANDALMHAQNKNMSGFKSSMGNFASSMSKAGAAGGDHVMKNTKVGDASLADHASAMSSKVTGAASDLHGKAMGWLSSFTANKSANEPAGSPIMGGRRRRSRKARKSRKHPQKGQKSRTKKGRKDFTTKKGNKYYNRRGHRQTKNAKGKRGRPYRTRKARKH